MIFKWHLFGHYREVFFLVSFVRATNLVWLLTFIFVSNEIITFLMYKKWLDFLSIPYNFQSFISIVLYSATFVFSSIVGF